MIMHVKCLTFSMMLMMSIMFGLLHPLFLSQKTIVGGFLTKLNIYVSCIFSSIFIIE